MQRIKVDRHRSAIATLDQIECARVDLGFTSEADFNLRNVGSLDTIAKQNEIKQQAAIKLVRAGIDGEKFAQRFRNEMQILAALGKHPGITSILDAGSTDTGQLYIAMDYVEGLRINEYCDSQRLGVRDRLRLFCRACEAVQFAHQNAVLHCDLKPSNILVTAEGQPVLIDFGVAKLTADDLDSSADAVQTQQHAFTPGYASPEQINGQRETTASDVYALGVVLYELLSGRQPHRLDGRSLAETVKLTCDTDPIKPSNAVTENVQGLTDKGPALVTPPMLGELRGVDSKRLQRELRGDLDCITMKAISKQPERRYGTVDQLTDDVKRFLDGKPVRAQPDRFAYRLKKYIRRNTAGVAAATGFIVMLLAGIAITSRFAVIANQAAESEREQRQVADRLAESEREQRQIAILSEQAEHEQRLIAEKREKTANEILGLFDNMLASADPRKSGVADYRARDLIEVLVHKLRSRVVDDPVVEARLLQSLASASIGTGDYPKANSLSLESISLLKENLGPTNLATVSAMYRYSEMALLSSDLGSARLRLRRIIALDDPSRNDDPQWNAIQFNTYLRLAEAETRDTRNGDLDTAKAVLDKAKEKIALLNPTKVGDAKYELKRRQNSLLLRLGKTKEAFPFAEAEYEKAIELYGEDNYRTATVGRTLAPIYMGQQRFHEAAKLFENSLQHSRKLLGNEHPETLVDVMELALSYYSAKRFDKAELFFREYESISVAINHYEGAHHHQILTYWANSLRELKQFKKAEKVAFRCYEFFAASFGKSHKDTLSTLRIIAAIHRDAGRHKLADTWKVAPRTPNGIGPKDRKVDPSGKLTLSVSGFVHDAPSMKHHATRWQIRSEKESYEYSPTLDVTTTEHLDRLAIPAGVLRPNRKYFWRVAHVGGNRIQSEFSDQQELRTEDLDYRLEPVDLTVAFNKDVVRSPGDKQEDTFNTSTQQLVIDGFQDENTHGVPRGRSIGPHRLGDYDQPNSIQLERSTAPISIDMPPNRFVALRFLLANFQAGYVRDGSAMNVTLEYQDGTKESRSVNCPDWHYKMDYVKTDSGVLPANIVRNGMALVFLGGKVVAKNNALFDTQIPVDPDRELKAVLLHPDESGLYGRGSRINVLAITGVVTD